MSIPNPYNPLGIEITRTKKAVALFADGYHINLGYYNTETSVFRNNGFGVFILNGSLWISLQNGNHTLMQLDNGSLGWTDFCGSASCDRIYGIQSGKLYKFDSPYHTKVQVGSDSKWKSICGRTNHTIFLSGYNIVLGVQGRALTYIGGDNPPVILDNARTFKEVSGDAYQWGSALAAADDGIYAINSNSTTSRGIFKVSDPIFKDRVEFISTTTTWTNGNISIYQLEDNTLVKGFNLSDSVGNRARRLYNGRTFKQLSLGFIQLGRAWDASYDSQPLLLDRDGSLLTFTRTENPDLISVNGNHYDYILGFPYPSVNYVPYAIREGVIIKLSSDLKTETQIRIGNGYIALFGNSIVDNNPDALILAIKEE